MEEHNIHVSPKADAWLIASIKLAQSRADHEGCLFPDYYFASIYEEKEAHTYHRSQKMKPFIFQQGTGKPNAASRHEPQ